MVIVGGRGQEVGKRRERGKREERRKKRKGEGGVFLLFNL
jgi:hypothetical protein